MNLISRFICTMPIIEKSSVITACKNQVVAKLAVLKSELLSLKESNEDNDKSSAGDKYETERSMVHQEMEKLVNQIDIEETILTQLRQINPDKSYNNVAERALVETNKGIYLLGAACGKVMLGATMVFGVSMESPLAMAMHGKTVGESFTLNGNAFSVVSVS